MLLSFMISKTRLLIIRHKKTVIFILILLFSSYISYDYGYSTGYHKGYSEGQIDGYLMNKYITHEYANFSNENISSELERLEHTTKGNDTSLVLLFNKFEDN